MKNMLLGLGLCVAAAANAFPNYATHADCIQYAVEVQHQPINNAVYACKQGVQRGCLETSVAQWQAWGASPINAWNNAVNGCRGNVSAECLSFAMNKNVELGYSDRNAWNNALRACQVGAQAGCLQYAYDANLRMFGNPRTALNNAEYACRGETKAECLQLLTETLNQPWNYAVNSCRP